MNKLVVAGTVLLALGLPWSTAMVSVGGGLLLLACVWDWKGALAVRPWREPAMAVGLVQLAIIVLRKAVSDE